VTERTDEHDAVVTFFAEQVRSDQYRSLKAQTDAFDRNAAEILNREISGRVLAVGGLWDHFERSSTVTELTVLDLTEEMLVTYTTADATALHGDLFDIELEPDSFDTVVFPLMLHHVAQGSWGECERRVHEALERVSAALGPGGRILIYEYCPAPWLRLAQRLVLPFTRRLLAHNGQPLVVMHSLRFYEDALTAVRGQANLLPITARPPRPWTWYPIFMSSRWLRIPIGLYPKPAILASYPSGPSARL